MKAKSSGGTVRTILIVGTLLALGSTTFLLGRGRSLAIDLLLLGSALARSLLGGRLAVSTLTIGTVTLRRGLFLCTALLRSGHGTTFRGGECELALDLGPGIGCGARVTHAGKGGKLLVVDLCVSVSMRDGIGGVAYLGRAGLEGLHSPGEHLHLSLSEGGSGVITSVRHSGCVDGVLVR
jgi:hypothetical protein